MSAINALAKLKNKAPYNRALSFFVDILLFDWLAMPITRVLAKIKWLTPNMVTVVSGLIGLVAAYYFYLGATFMGVVSIYFSFLLDCVDGNLARKTGRTSKIGATLDNTADTIKKIACIAALVYISSWNVFLLSGLVVVHYMLQRVFPQKYVAATQEKLFTSKGLEPLFSSYDLLVLLLLVGPLVGFEFTLIVIIVIQIITAVYSRFILK